jgi:hypothetical protein
VAASDRAPVHCNEVCKNRQWDHRGMMERAPWGSGELALEALAEDLGGLGADNLINDLAVLEDE